MRLLDRSWPESRFFWFTIMAGLYVELTVLGISAVRSRPARHVEYRLLALETSRLHFPLTCSAALREQPRGARNRIVIVAAISITISMAWFIVIGLNTTMGVAWHRFSSWPNIWFKRESSWQPALGALQPIAIDSKSLDFSPTIEDLGRRHITRCWQGGDFTWKGLLDFTLLHHRGAVAANPSARPGMQRQAASPKLLIMDLREHGHAKGRPICRQREAAREPRCPRRPALPGGAPRPLVGPDREFTRRGDLVGHRP